MLSFLICVLLGPRVIDWLRRLKVGDIATFDQAEMDTLMEGKNGTPTMGGLLIIAATTYDNKIRAFDKSNGKLLWEGQLPAAGMTTPSTYMVNRKQYIVIACGGGKNGAPSGGTYVAFALP